MILAPTPSFNELPSALMTLSFKRGVTGNYIEYRSFSPNIMTFCIIVGELYEMQSSFRPLDSSAIRQVPITM